MFPTQDMSQQRDKPSYAHLLLTGKCNLRCPQCFVDAGTKYEGEMNTLELLHAADELVKMGIRTVHVEGGEPLLQPEAVEVLERLRDIPDVLVVTNGTLIDEERAQRLASAGLKQVALSLDGATAETHNFFRENTFDKVVNAIALLREAGLGVRISTTLMRPNVHEANMLLEKCLEWGIRILNYDAFDQIGRGVGNRDLSLEDEHWKVLARELLPRAKEVADRMQVKVAIPSKYVKLLGIDENDPDYEWTWCTSGLSQLLIRPDGAVMPCFVLASQENYVAGNVKEQPLDEIWHDSPYLRLYRKLPLAKRCPMGYQGHLFFSNVRAHGQVH